MMKGTHFNNTVFFHTSFDQSTLIFPRKENSGGQQAARPFMKGSVFLKVTVAETTEEALKACEPSRNCRGSFPGAKACRVHGHFLVKWKKLKDFYPFKKLK